ncbi:MULTISPECIES: DUF3939 domain-containing protein [Gracilibacillus]|uniref:DUF3939 domain-containing protein n=1 Tax=Gracilibacillus dipsosauri TaxID=178340 RepID=A0A317L1V2_9BACI|nr:DUF3939 domain-containing protein [Gracilibacillus dipsosauri]PWU67769.1 DUF3939 domain-containing protein [Gracilibacillus dipsosauri]
MWRKILLKKKPEDKHPVKEISYAQMKKAIQEYSLELPKNIPLQVLIKDDLSVDHTLLLPYLKAIPKKTFYMSKETYDLFEEEERHIAVALDQVQRAVDQYIAQKKSLPIIDHDPYRKVSFFKLEQLNLIQERPEIDFFITDQEYLVTTKKPQ